MLDISSLRQPGQQEPSQRPSAALREAATQGEPAGPAHVQPIDLSEIPASLWELARARMAVIGPLARMSRRTRADVRAAAERLGHGVSSTYELLARFRKNGRLTSLLPRRSGRRPGSRQLEPEREEIVRAAIDQLYLSRQQISVSALMIEIRARCRANGLRAPSRRAVQRRIDARSAQEVLCRRRGKKAARDRFGPVTGSLTTTHALEIVQVDHTQVDVILVDSLTREPIKRPWLTLAIDVHTRCVLGLALSLDPPSATSVALCIAHAAVKKDSWLAERGIEANWSMSGLPERLLVDNGPEFHSDALTRGCEQYGIALDYRPVRTPHFGGHIERLIGTMMGKVHLLPGTTFSNITQKGDANPAQTSALTLEELEQWLAMAITRVYHETVHRGLGMTPATAWRRAHANIGAHCATGPRSAEDARRLFLDFLPLQHRLVRRDGITLYSIAYWSDVLTTWIGDRKKQIVRYDPRNLSRIYLAGPGGTYYEIPYRDLYRPPISLWEHRAALRHLRTQGYRSWDEAALFRAIEEMRRIAERASSETRIVRRHRERQRQWRKTLGPAPPTPAVATPVLPDEVGANADVFSSVEDWS
jgi:putative transposase